MPTQDSTQADTTYEQARDELLDVVRRLEGGSTTLEESLALWERGEQLAGICQQWLDGARARLTAATDGGRSPSEETDQPLRSRTT
jgi:exodeoxyribonuclease VII small subunit